MPQFSGSVAFQDSVANVPLVYEHNYTPAWMMKSPIPLILHQLWKSHEIPSFLAPTIASWRAVNPNLQHILWTDSDVERFVKKFYPKRVYDALQSVKISQPEWQRGAKFADLARVLILYKMGGIYADIDYAANKSLESVLSQGHYGVLTREPEIFAIYLWDNKNLLLLNTAFMMFAPKHDFLRGYIEDILSRHPSKEALLSYAGPLAATRFLRRYMDQRRLDLREIMPSTSHRHHNFIR